MKQRKRLQGSNQRDRGKITGMPAKKQAKVSAGLNQLATNRDKNLPTLPFRH